MKLSIIFFIVKAGATECDWIMMESKETLTLNNTKKSHKSTNIENRLMNWNFQIFNNYLFSKSLKFYYNYETFIEANKKSKTYSGF